MTQSVKRKPRRRLRKSIRDGLHILCLISIWLGFSCFAISIVEATGGTNMRSYGSLEGNPDLCERIEEPVIERLEPIIVEEPETVEDKIKKACEEYDIPYDIVISIARLETGWFKSSAYLEGNNPGGMSINEVPIVYNSLDDGVDAFVSNLAENYFALGLDTPEEIGRKYCPINPEWSNVVSQLVEELNESN